MLLTKLHIPPAGINTVLRSELFTSLNAGLARKLILISAPAGFGKTTLVSDWINQNNIPTAWFSIGNGDNDPAVFLSYIISGIQTIESGFGEDTLRLLISPNRPSDESITGLLINDILHVNQNFLLVLDDFHLIKSNDVIKIVSYLLEHLPGNMHIVILTRSDPSFSISRLRSQHQLVELRASDLSFSENDIFVLFNKKLKLGLSLEDVYALKTKTEGWIAGLQLAALSMQGRENISEIIQDFKGDNRYIMDYLVEEVLKIQTEDIKEFLLQTSILEQMSAPLCNAVLKSNESQNILEMLEKNNMFMIPLDNVRVWYRYHHLFAELLKQRLYLKDKTVIIELHNKASEWFKNNAMPIYAIEHAIKSEDLEKCILFLGEIAESLWKNGQHASILKYGNLLPDDIIKKSADFCLYYAWILIITGKIQKVEVLLKSAENAAMQIINDKNSPVEDVRNHKKLSGKISVAFAYFYSVTANSEKTISYGKAAMENLTEDDPLWFSWGWYSIGMAEMSRDNFRESIQAFENALENGKKSQNIYLITTVANRLSTLEARMGLYTSSYKKCADLINFMKESGYSQITKSECTYAGVYSSMAGIDTMRTDFDKALENIKTAYCLCKKESNNTIKVHVIMVYSLALYGRGDIAGVKKMIAEADDILKQNIVFPTTMSIYISMKGFMLINQNELEKASQFFKENGIAYDKKIPYSFEHAYCDYSLLLITQKKFSEAEILLSELLKMAQAANRTERIIETKVICAILNKAKGNREKAILNLIEALEDAVNEYILMSFVYFHERIKELLPEVFKIVATTKTKIPGKLTDKLKLALEKREKYMKVHWESGLSERELDTLRLMAGGLTNQEIANKMFISLNTVKTHLKNVFLKLKADNRTNAIDKAKEHGLI